MLYSRSDFIFGPSMFFLLRRPPPESTLFPYTTLFRSQRLGRQAVLCRDLDQRVDGGDRLRGHAALEPIAHRLRGERRGEERGDEEDQPHRLTARTITIEFSRPKLSATSRSARWSGIQRSPSTTNMYSYVPAGRTRAPRHTPSWSGPSSAIVPVRQSLNDPTTCTERAPGKRPTNWAIPSCSPSIGPPHRSPRGTSASSV